MAELILQALADEPGWCAVRFVRKDWRTERKLYSPSRLVEIIDPRRRSFLSTFNLAVRSTDMFGCSDVAFVPTASSPFVALELFGVCNSDRITGRAVHLAATHGAHARRTDDGCLILWFWSPGWKTNMVWKDCPFTRYARLTAKGAAVPLGEWLDWSARDIGSVDMAAL